MVTLAASVRCDADLTESNVNLLISFSAAWIRVENAVLERGECDTSLLNSIFQVFLVFRVQGLSFSSVHPILQTMKKGGGATASIGSNVNLEFW